MFWVNEMLLPPFCLLYSMLAGPHPRSLSRGDFAPRSGRGRCRYNARNNSDELFGTTTSNGTPLPR